ncbi:TPA: heavy metal transporter [Shewanella algae]|nr:heavy metal transporter [Shewanella algae]QTE84546.1 heavy metal transporter [Shewanella algae]QTE84548.1 heavy metal transporter [Shewanella algae]HDS1213349.1 heavy metal transporter [Shewanella algae]
MMLFEIYPDEQTCEPRVIKGTNGKPDRVVYDQKIYWIKGRQVVQLVVSHNEMTSAYPAGQYTLHEDSFEADAMYGRGFLKINWYSVKFVPVNNAQKSSVKPV